MSMYEILRPKSSEELKDLERRGFRKNMGKWKFCIDISNILKKCKPLYKIKTKSDKEIKISGDYSIIVFRDNNELKIKACDLLKTDKIINNNSDNPYLDEITLLEETYDEKDLSIFKESIINLLKEKSNDINTFVIKNENNNLKPIITAFENVILNIDDFDLVMDQLYDWADKNNVWIESSNDIK